MVMQPPPPQQHVPGDMFPRLVQRERFLKSHKLHLWGSRPANRFMRGIHGPRPCPASAHSCLHNRHASGQLRCGCGWLRRARGIPATASPYREGPWLQLAPSVLPRRSSNDSIILPRGKFSVLQLPWQLRSEGYFPLTRTSEYGPLRTSAHPPLAPQRRSSPPGLSFW